MEDRDGKKPFIIPKTHTSTKDVVISEKPDSRNVTELFDDIKSCALEAQFDFRQNGCKSCDTIRNQKLQKLYNEKRIKIKKDQDPIERLAFHLITYRDIALNVANDGLGCEQLSFPIDKYLGNPKDGVHLSRRPDVLLTSSGAQGLYRFGLLVCKVLLGKGYATISSTTNNQLPAQLHYDHHFCKIQSITKEQRHIDDLLANSLIFCYEHENFEPVSHPPQILPIAILWYDLTEKFAPEILSISNQESQHRIGKITNGRTTLKKKTIDLSTKSIPSNSNKLMISPSISNTGTWDESIQDTTNTNTTHNSNTIESSSTTKYPSHFMVPYPRLHSNPPLFTSSSTEEHRTNTTQPISKTRDPRLLRTKRETTLISSETIPLPPHHLIHERSLSDSSSSSIKPLQTSSDGLLLITKSSSLIYIPLNSSVSLIDPRLKTIKQTRGIFYLELQAVKHALHQQKRLNHYHDLKNGLIPKTSYTLVPFLIREVSNTEYERILHDDNSTYKFNKHSNSIDYSSLYVSVVDCFNFGLLKSQTNNLNYIDLEHSENKLAFEQIEISNELIQREKQLNSQQIRLHLREKRQKRIQQQINDKQYLKSSLISPSTTSVSNSKLYIATGRQLLREHKISTISPDTHMSSDLLDFFSREYKNENRPHVKHLLAELVGVFIEKYHVDSNQTMGNNGQNGERNHSSVEEPLVDDQTINSVIDMDLDSPSSQGLCDYDERFRVPSPPPPPLPPPLTILPPLPSIYPRPLMSLNLTQTLPNEPNKIFDDPNYNDRCQKLVEQLKEQYRQKETSLSSTSLITKSESIIPTEEEAIFKACLGHCESSSSENSPVDDSPSLVISEDVQHEDNIILPLVQDSSINIPDDSNRSREEFVKLLTKEACISKSSSPAKDQDNHKRSYDYHNQRRRSHDDDNNNNKKKTSLSNHSSSHQRYSRPSNNKTRRSKPAHKKVSGTRTVTLVSNRCTIPNENSEEKQNTEISPDNQNDSQEKPAVKRIKVDSTSSPLNTTNEVENTDEINQNDLDLKSIVTMSTISDDHDYRRDLNEKRRTASNTNSVVSSTDNSKSKSSRSRSRSKSKDRHPRRQSSANSHSSSMKNSKTTIESNKKSQTYSRSSSISSRTSSNDNRHRPQQKQNRNEHRHGQKRSSDLSNRHRQQYPNQFLSRHEIFNDTSYRNSLPSMYHQCDMNDIIPPSNLHHLQQQQPVRHKRFNYNHQSVADHPRFANSHVLPPPTPLMDFNYPKSPTHHRSVSPVSIGDRNVNPSYYQNESTKLNYSNCFYSKPSNTIERLQMLLQNKTENESQMDYSGNGTVKYSPSSIDNDNSHWTSSSYLSKIESDIIMQNNNNNNQTFTYNDTEKLLTMVQRLRN